LAEIPRCAVIDSLLQCLISIAATSIVWAILGFSLAFGETWGGSGFIGNPGAFPLFIGLDMCKAWPGLVLSSCYVPCALQFLAISCLRCPRGVALDFGLDPSDSIMNQLGNPSSNKVSLPPSKLVRHVFTRIASFHRQAREYRRCSSLDTR
jgi:hypothetical protein